MTHAQRRARRRAHKARQRELRLARKAIAILSPHPEDYRALWKTSTTTLGIQIKGFEVTPELFASIAQKKP